MYSLQLYTGLAVWFLPRCSMFEGDLGLRSGWTDLLGGCNLSGKSVFPFPSLLSMDCCALTRYSCPAPFSVPPVVTASYITIQQSNPHVANYGSGAHAHLRGLALAPCVAGDPHGCGYRHHPCAHLSDVTPLTGAAHPTGAKMGVCINEGDWRMGGR